MASALACLAASTIVDTHRPGDDPDVMAVRATTLVAVVIATGCGRFGFDVAPPRLDASHESSDATSDATSDASFQFVQATPLTSLGSVTEGSVTFPSPPTDGDMIVVYAWSWAMGTTSFGPSAATDTVSYTHLTLPTKRIV